MPNDRDILLYNLTPMDFPPLKLPRIEVSPSGEVRVRRSARNLGTPLKPDYTSRGQPRIKLRGPDGLHRNVLLHRVVYFAHTFDVRMFHKNVLHLDGNTGNCHILNLRVFGDEERDIYEVLTPDAQRALHLEVFRPEQLVSVRREDVSLENKIDTLNDMLKGIMAHGT